MNTMTLGMIVRLNFSQSIRVLAQRTESVIDAVIYYHSNRN